MGSAKRIIVGKIFSLNAITLRHTRHYGERGGSEGDSYSWLDLSTWPPTEHPSEHQFGSIAYSPENGLWALAIESGDSEGELRITDSPVAPTFSRRVAFPEIDGWREKRAADPLWHYYNADTFRPQSSLCWLGDDLFITYEVYTQSKTIYLQAWVVRGAAQGGTACAEVLAVPLPDYPSDKLSRVASGPTSSRAGLPAAATSSLRRLKAPKSSALSVL